MRAVVVDRAGDDVHRRRSDEAGDEHVGRVHEQLARCCALLQHAVVQHGDAIAHRHRLDLVVGDVDGRDAEPLLQRGDLGAGLDAELGVEVRQRLVHEEDLRLAHDRPPHRHPLTLTARQLGRLAVEVLLEVEDACRFLDPLPRSDLATFFTLRWKPMFSATVMCGYSAYDWKTIAMSRSFGGTMVTSSSPMRIEP